MAAGDAQRAVEAVFRIERARLIAGLARMVRDVDRAEELAQDALLVALAEWPTEPVDPFFNVNTPEDVERATELAASIPSAPNRG